MAHSIRAFVGKTNVFRHSWLACPIAAVQLDQDMRLVAMTHELWQQIYSDEECIPKRANIRISGWRDPERRFLERLSKNGPVAFIETDYFGGSGNQGAIVAKDGKLVFGPRAAQPEAINQALRLLGVTITKDDHDEFDALELQRYRDNEAIIRAFAMSNWIRAWFVLAESDRMGLEEVARKQPELSIRHGSSGLYSATAVTPYPNLVEEFLMNHSTEMHDIELSREDFYWVSEFFRNTHHINLKQPPADPLNELLEQTTSIDFIFWSAENAKAVLEALNSSKNNQQTFARYNSPAFHTPPPQSLVERFPDVLASLRAYFEKITPDFMGILLDL